MSRFPGVALSAALALAAPLAAQDSAATLARMEMRLDSLQRLVAEGDRAALDGSATDTVVAGRIRVATSAALRPFVEPAAAAAWTGVLARFGPAIAAKRQLPIQQFGGSRGGTLEQRDIPELATAFEATAARAIWGQLDSLLSRWLEGSYPITPLGPDALEEVLEDLVRMPARPNRACLDGDPGACASVLGLGSVPDRLGEWYPPAAWARLARMANAPRSAAEEPCYDHQEIEACRAIILSARIPPPVGMAGRQLLMQLALDAGGPGAFGRLTADSGVTVEHRLAAAAGMPVDSLLVEWAATIRAATPGSPMPSARMTLLVLGWCAVVLVLSRAEGRWG